MALEHLPVTVRLSYSGIGRWIAFLALPRNLLAGSPTNNATVQLRLEGAAGARRAVVYIGATSQDGDDFEPEIETGARITLTASDGTQLYRDGFAGDTADPYSLPISDADYNTVRALRQGSWIDLKLEVGRTPVNADPGNVSVGAPAASGQATPEEDPVNADAGAVSTAAPSASARAVPEEDPVHADPGNVSTAAPSASAEAEGVLTTPRLADASAVSTAAPTAAGPELQRRRPTRVNADPGTVSTAAPTASAEAAPQEDPVNADPGNVSTAAPSASARATPEEDPVEAHGSAVSLAAPSASARAERRTFVPLVAADPGRVSLAAPSASLRVAVGEAEEIYREARIGLSPEARIVTCIEITHPQADDPIRLVDDGEDVVIGGERYLAARFDAVTTGDGGQGAPRGQLLIGNVGRQVSRWIDDAGGGAGGQARVMEVLLVGGAASVEWELAMDIASIATGENVTVGLGFDPLLGRPLVAMRYDPETAPGLF